MEFASEVYELISNNPSRLGIIAVIILSFIGIYFLVSAAMLKTRKEDLEDVAELIKERHNKIENYEVAKLREESANHEETTGTNNWGNN